MPELWFYHLERTRIDDALPELLLKLQSRGGRAVVTSPEEGRLAHLDQHLWTFRDDSFLPHGLASGPLPEDQPILLSETADKLNQASMLFCLDGADPGELDGWERVVVMFEASDETTLAKARALWSRYKESDILRSYWKQNEQGRWEKQG